MPQNVLQEIFCLVVLLEIFCVILCFVNVLHKYFLVVVKQVLTSIARHQRWKPLVKSVHSSVQQLIFQKQEKDETPDQAQL